MSGIKNTKTVKFNKITEIPGRLLISGSWLVSWLDWSMTISVPDCFGPGTETVPPPARYCHQPAVCCSDLFGLIVRILY